MGNGQKPIIFLTGANGFLGRYLAKAFSESGFKVIGLVQNVNVLNSKWGIEEARAFSLGKTLAPELFQGFEGHEEKILVHCAWFAPWNALKQNQVLRPIQSFVTNVEGTETLYEHALSSGVKRILFIGSLAAQDGTESIYGQHKWAVERTTLQLGGAVLKPGVIIGPNIGIETAANFSKYRNLVKKLPILPNFFPRSEPMQTVWVEEVGELAVEIVKKGQWGKEWIAGEPRGVNLSEFYKGVGVLVGRECRVLNIPRPFGDWIFRLSRWLERCPDARFWKQAGRWSSLVLPLLRALILKNPIPSDSLAGLKYLRWHSTVETDQGLRDGKSCRPFRESLLTIAKLEKTPDSERRLLQWARQ